MSLRRWLEEEIKDLIQRVVFYPKRRYFMAVFVIFFLFWSLSKTWSLSNRHKVVELDRFIVERLDQLRTPFFDTVFLTITSFGSLRFILVLFFLIFIFLIIKRRKRAAVVSFISLFFSISFLFFFKFFFARERPGGCPGDSLECFSFPSGHTTLSFYFYGLLGYLLHRFFFTFKFAFHLLILFSLALVTLIAISRVYLGVHYTSDLVGGILLGGIFLFGAIILIDLLYR